MWLLNCGLIDIQWHCLRVNEENTFLNCMKIISANTHIKITTTFLCFTYDRNSFTFLPEEKNNTFCQYCNMWQIRLIQIIHFLKNPNYNCQFIKELLEGRAFCDTGKMNRNLRWYYQWRRWPTTSCKQRHKIEVHQKEDKNQIHVWYFM